MAKLRNIRFMNAGYCRQLAYWTGASRIGFQEFHAVVIYFEHPQHGAFLIDTGYGPKFWQATTKLPFRSYRWLLPTRVDAQHCISAALAESQIKPRELAGVFVSHFHPDHIAGLSCLPKLPLILRVDALSQLRSMGALKQLQHGFIPDLLADCVNEIHGINEVEFQPLSTGLCRGSNFCGIDYWGDESLILIDLPGHALGHTGYLLTGEQESLLYVVDATWNVATLLNSKQIPWLARSVQSNYSQYWETQQQLSTLSHNHDVRLLACHCPRTQEYVRTQKGR